MNNNKLYSLSLAAFVAMERFWKLCKTLSCYSLSICISFCLKLSGNLIYLFCSIYCSHRWIGLVVLWIHSTQRGRILLWWPGYKIPIQRRHHFSCPTLSRIPTCPNILCEFNVFVFLFPSSCEWHFFLLLSCHRVRLVNFIEKTHRAVRNSLTLNRFHQSRLENICYRWVRKKIFATE